MGKAVAHIFFVFREGEPTENMTTNENPLMKEKKCFPIILFVGNCITRHVMHKINGIHTTHVALPKL